MLSHTHMDCNLSYGDRALPQSLREAEEIFIEQIQEVLKLFASMHHCTVQKIFRAINHPHH